MSISLIGIAIDIISHGIGRRPTSSTNLASLALILKHPSNIANFHTNLVIRLGAYLPGSSDTNSFFGDKFLHAEDGVEEEKREQREEFHRVKY